MKRFAKILVLLGVVMTMFVSCHKCVVCGEKKLCHKNQLLGTTYYICNDCDK